MKFLTDFHSHILPGIDDGSDSLEASLRLLELSGQQGVRHVFATPHFYAHRDSLDVFLEKRARAEKLLREAVSGRPDLPDFTVGAEVYFFRGMSESDALEKLKLGSSDCILVEMPFTAWTDSMYRELEQIRDRQGLTPIVAHVERYFGSLSTRGIPERLGAMGILIQSNAEFFLDRKTAPRALRLLKQGKIHLLGSDCHNLTNRPPRLGEAVQRIEKSLGESAMKHLENCSSRVLPEDRPET